MLAGILVPIGMLGMLSLSAAYYCRMHLIAGAFWLLISLLSLSQWGLIYGVIGLAVGASHLIVMGRELRKKNKTEAV